jgi:cytoskeletal protein CcmA (bactofilin family)
MWKQQESREPKAPLTEQRAPAPPPRSVALVSSPTECALIGSTILIKGDLSGDEDLVIEGRVEGKIELAKNNVTIGKKGRVKADVYGKVITVEGEVHGNLFGEDQLVLRQSSTVRGNMVAPRVILEDGADFKGSIDMSPKASGQKEATPFVPPSSPDSSAEDR